jgi:hypothetical protein
MKIKILKPIIGYAYFGGEVVEMDDRTAAEWVAKGKALMIPDVIRDMPTVKTVIREDEVIRKSRRK